MLTYSQESTSNETPATTESTVNQNAVNAEQGRTVLQYPVDYDFKSAPSMANPFRGMGGNFTVDQSLIGARGDKNVVKAAIIPQNNGDNRPIVIIDDYVFEDFTALEYVEFPRSAENLGKATFSGCTALKTIKFANHSEEIDFDDECFKGCVSLEELTFPDSMKQIDFHNASFSGCTALKTITFPKGIKKVKFAKDTFEGCESLTEETRAALKKLKYKGKF